MQHPALMAVAKFECNFRRHVVIICNQQLPDLLWLWPHLTARRVGFLGCFGFTAFGAGEREDIKL